MSIRAQPEEAIYKTNTVFTSQCRRGWSKGPTLTLCPAPPNLVSSDSSLFSGYREGNSPVSDLWNPNLSQKQIFFSARKCMHQGYILGHLLLSFIHAVTGHEAINFIQSQGPAEIFTDEIYHRHGQAAPATPPKCSLFSEKMEVNIESSVNPTLPQLGGRQVERSCRLLSV